MIKKITSKSQIYGDWRPAFAVTSQCLEIPLRSASVAPLFKWTVRILRRAVSLCDIKMDSMKPSMHSHDKTNERTLSYQCANNALERCQSNYRKYCRITWFLTKNQVILICRPRRLNRSPIRAMYWINHKRTMILIWYHLQLGSFAGGA